MALEGTGRPARADGSVGARGGGLAGAHRLGRGQKPNPLCCLRLCRRRGPAVGGRCQVTGSGRAVGIVSIVSMAPRRRALPGVRAGHPRGRGRQGRRGALYPMILRESELAERRAGRPWPKPKTVTNPRRCLRLYRRRSCLRCCRRSCRRRSCLLRRHVRRCHFRLWRRRRLVHGGVQLLIPRRRRFPSSKKLNQE